MSSRVKIRHSSTAAHAPTAGQLEIAELAVNLVDKVAYSKDAGGSIIELYSDRAQRLTAGFLENDILQAAANGGLKSTGLQLNDAGTGDKDLWSAQKIDAQISAVGGGGSEWTHLGDLTWADESGQRTLTITGGPWDLVRFTFEGLKVRSLDSTKNAIYPAVMLNNISTLNYDSLHRIHNGTGGSRFLLMWHGNSGMWTTGSYNTPPAHGEYFITGKKTGGWGGDKTIWGRCDYYPHGGLSVHSPLVSGKLAGDGNDLSSIRIQPSSSGSPSNWRFTGTFEFHAKNF